MTRINAGLKPKELTDKHLLAEHREIKRIPNHLAKFGKPKAIPKQFTLGTGHVLFFIDKGKYLLERYFEVYRECKNRGFNVTDFSDAWLIYQQFPEYYNTWIETPEARELIKQRIYERLNPR